jgi:hypothetical protein
MALNLFVIARQTEDGYRFATDGWAGPSDTDDLFATGSEHVLRFETEQDAADYLRDMRYDSADLPASFKVRELLLGVPL